MRVVMVSDVYFPRINGVSTAIQTYRQALAGHGVDVRLVAPDYGRPGGADDASWITRVPARPVPGDPEDRLVRWGKMHDAVEAVVEQGCDLIHVQTPFVAHYAACCISKRYGLPVLATYHTLFEEYLKHYAPLIPASLLRGLARRFSRRQCNALDAVIVPSRAIERRLGEYGVTTPMHILPTGISLGMSAENGRSEFRRRHGIDLARPVALFVGRVAHEKNIDYLLDVVDLARAWVPDILLVIAGEGPALGTLRRIVADRGLRDCVQFIGYLDRQNELPACYAAADVFVFASRTETQGLVLLEAMAAGLPVVALAEMGTVDILGAGRGTIVPEDNPYAFALAIANVLHDPALRHSLSVDARAYAGEWSDTALAGRMAELYRDVNRAHARRQVSDFSFSPL
ncbi:MAG: glycosyltransferase [Propionivibrio sp.]